MANGSTVWSNNPSMEPQHHTGNLAEAVKEGEVAHLQMDFGVNSSNAAEIYQRYRYLLSDEVKSFLDIVNRQSRSTEGAGGPKGVLPGYMFFLLQNVNEPRDEKVQVTETVGNNFIAHFFGERAKTWRYSGWLYNTVEDPWYDAWHILYRGLFRGSQVADLHIPARLVYGNKVVEGAMIRSATTMQANTENAARFDFSFLVSKEKIHLGSFVDQVSTSETDTEQFDPSQEIQTSVDDLERARTIVEQRGNRQEAEQQAARVEQNVSTADVESLTNTIAQAPPSTSDEAIQSLREERNQQVRAREDVQDITRQAKRVRDYLGLNETFQSKTQTATNTFLTQNETPESNG